MMIRLPCTFDINLRSRVGTLTNGDSDKVRHHKSGHVTVAICDFVTICDQAIFDILLPSGKGFLP